MGLATVIVVNMPLTMPAFHIKCSGPGLSPGFAPNDSFLLIHTLGSSGEQSMCQDPDTQMGDPEERLSAALAWPVPGPPSF